MSTVRTNTNYYYPSKTSGKMAEDNSGACPTVLRSEGRSGNVRSDSTMADSPMPAQERGTAEPRPRYFSTVETLPVEILEKIFLYSLNVNLPCASPSLAATLSSEPVYRVLILLAFFDDPLASYPDYAAIYDASLSVASVSHILRPLGSDYQVLPLEERRTLQSAILQFKWCTADRIRGRLLDLERLLVRRVWGAKPDVSMKPTQKRDLEEYLATGRTRSDRGFRAIDEGIQSYVAIEKSRNASRPYGVLSIDSSVAIKVETFSYESAEQGVTGEGGEGDAEIEAMEHTWPVLSVLDLPSTLLRGEGDEQPFSERRLAFIELFCTAGGLIDPFQIALLDKLAVSEGALQDGIMTAIVARNPRALTFLLRLEQNIRDSRGESYIIPQDRFRAAARMSKTLDNGRRIPCSMFRSLVRVSSRSVPFADPEVGQFTKDVGGVFEQWLLAWRELYTRSARLNPAFPMAHNTAEFFNLAIWFTEIDRDMAATDEDGDHFTVDDIRPR